MVNKYRNFYSLVQDSQSRINALSDTLAIEKSHLKALQRQYLLEYKNHIIKSYLNKWLYNPDNNLIFEYNDLIYKVVMILAGLESHDDISIRLSIQNNLPKIYYTVNNVTSEIKPLE